MQRRTVGTWAACLLAAGSAMAQMPAAKVEKVIAQTLNTPYLAFEAETSEVQTELEAPNRWLLTVDEDASGGKAMQGNVPNGRTVHATESLLSFKLKFTQAGTYNLFVRDRVTPDAKVRCPKREESWVWYPGSGARGLVLNEIGNHPQGWIGQSVFPTYDWRCEGWPMTVTDDMVGKVQEFRISVRLDGYLADRYVLSTLGAGELQEKFGSLDKVPPSKIVTGK